MTAGLSNKRLLNMRRQPMSELPSHEPNGGNSGATALNTSIVPSATANNPTNDRADLQCERGISATDANPKSYPFSQKLLAEAIGTFIIVYLGCSTVCTAIYYSAQQGIFQIAAVWAMAVTLAIYSSAGISGAHLNPAISIAMKICRPSDHKDMGWDKVALYCAAQTVGAVIGAAVNLGLYWESIIQYESANNIIRGDPNSKASAAAFGEYWSVSTWQQAFLAETMGTLFLSFIIFTVTNPQNDAIPDKLAPALIGGTVGCLLSIIAPLTQAGFNPARDFGPRIITWLAGWKGVAMQGWWVYVFAPIVGAILGGLLSEKLLWRKPQ